MAKARVNRPNRALQEQDKNDTQARPYRAPVSEDPDIKTAYGIGEDMFPRWTLDMRNRVQKRLGQGYQFVYSTDVKIGEESLHYGSEIGSAISRPAGWDSRSGKPLMEYLMVIPLEDYRARQQYKESLLAEDEEYLTEDAQSNFSGAPEGKGHVATPYGKVSREA